ncbi:MAG: hypothetical protein JSS27_04610 [Planctomycetes bacterium]|nr:hypothetical protein [Planctomycetota bacterium]
MKRTILVSSILVPFGFIAAIFFTGIGPPTGESAVGWSIGETEFRIDFGYSLWGLKLRYAIVRSWPKDARLEERINDPRVGRDYLGRRLVRAENGKLVQPGSEGTVYLFDGAAIKTMRVQMNEHDDTVGLNTAQNLDEVWAHFRRFEVGKVGGAANQ